MKIDDFNKEVNAFKEQVIKMMTHAFKEMGTVEPTVLTYMYTPGSEIQPIGFMSGFSDLMHSSEDRAAVAKTIKEMVKETEPIALAFVTQATAIKGKKQPGESLEEMKERIRNNKEIEEDVFVISLETYCMEYTVLYSVKKEGDIISLDLIKEPEWKDKLGETGNFGNLLEECYVDFEDQDDLDLT